MVIVRDWVAWEGRRMRRYYISIFQVAGIIGIYHHT
jgi:hypothetical protein